MTVEAGRGERIAGRRRGARTEGSPLKVKDVARIAVLRANAIGDWVFALPALESLRHAYPDAEIVLLGAPWHARFLAGRPAPVDRVVVVPPYRGVRGDRDDPAEIEAFFAAMRAERFDLALQLHGGGAHSNPFVRRLGARVTAGLQADGAPPLDRNLPYVYFQPEIVRYLEAVGLVGVPPLTLAPRVALTPRDVEDARQALAEDGTPLALLHPGATDPRRRWPVECFAAVGRALAHAGAKVVVTGTGDERPLCRELVAAVPGAIALCDALSLGGLAGLLARCKVVVANDTGPMHLAAALGTPTVCVYWSFNLVNSSQILRARHRPFVSWRQHCPFCHADCTQPRCEHEVSFVADVPAEPVSHAALALLGEREHAEAPCFS
jgi:ADP-heptose:LPS heptosyltransferase